MGVTTQVAKASTVNFAYRLPAEEQAKTKTKPEEQRYKMEVHKHKQNKSQL